jgi:peptidoglycan/xylan/chitin deacetylase (PgdA/CDA1 family)
VIILNYHRASQGDLRSHLLYLRRAYHILPLEQALRDLYAPSEQKNRDRRTRLVLTFDDGYHDNYSHAAELARELQVPLTVFLIPGYVDSNARFWWHEGERLVCNARVDQAMLGGRLYRLDQPEDGRLLARAIYEGACHASSVAQREVFLSSVREALDAPASATERDDPLRPLTWAEVQAMEETGWISFGAHSMHHPVLGYLADPGEVQREVQECRAVLENRLGHRVHAFAYPLGRMEHIGTHGFQAVQDGGYDWAVTTERGINNPHVHPLLLRRIVVDDGHQYWLFLAADVAGVWPFFLRLRKRLLDAVRPQQHPACAPSP